jgi:hypothetical protein
LQVLAIASIENLFHLEGNGQVTALQPPQILACAMVNFGPETLAESHFSSYSGLQAPRASFVSACGHRRQKPRVDFEGAACSG